MHSLHLQRSKRAIQSFIVLWIATSQTLEEAITMTKPQSKCTATQPIPREKTSSSKYVVNSRKFNVNDRSILIHLKGEACSEVLDSKCIHTWCLACIRTPSNGSRHSSRQEEWFGGEDEAVGGCVRNVKLLVGVIRRACECWVHIDGDGE